MLPLFFEQQYFLQALGWGIANSLWQSALLWLAYQLATAGKRQISASFKYQLSLLMLFLSVGWFVVTITYQYLALLHGDISTSMMWIYYGSTSSGLPALSIVYLCLLFVVAARFFRSFQAVTVLGQSSMEKVPVHIRLFTQQAALHIGIGKKVSVWFSRKVDVPCVIGFVKPIILLPITTFNHLSTAQAESIILHELAHIKRNDFLVNLLQSVAELMLFFNPFAKMLGTVARTQREHCCDDWVMNYQYNHHEYARALLLLEQHRMKHLPIALAATNGKKLLLGRIKRLFETQSTTGLTGWHRIKLSTILLLVILGTVVLRPVQFNQPGALSAVTIISKDALTAGKPVAIAKTPLVSIERPANIKNIKPETQPAKGKALTASATHATAESYTAALINKNLLPHETNALPVAIAAAQISTSPDQQMVVSVEQEQSGVQGKTNYIFMVRRDGDSSEIIPLIILKKETNIVSENDTKQHKADSLARKSIPKKQRTS